MLLSDLIQLCGILVALVIGIISIIISVLTMRQNSKMIEESTRPVISIYGESINTGSPLFYIVVKNFGLTSATITRFDYDFDFKTSYYSSGEAERDFLKDLVGSTIAPQQSRICNLQYKKIDRPIHFDIEYKTTSKSYKESLTVNLKAGAAMVIAKNASKDAELRNISYTLQEMLQKRL